MKRVISISYSITILLFIVFNSACDKIDNPVRPIYGDLDTSLYPGPGFYIYPEFDLNYPSDVENVLIEDYTGHTCGNCPGAAIIAHDLKDANPGRVFVTAVHASPTDGFQEVNLPDDPDYPKYSHDFRTEAGNDYVDDINGFIGNPQGMVNRKLSDSDNDNWEFAPAWGTAVEAIISANNPLQMNIQVKTNYYTETRGLFVHVQSKTLANMSGRYNMVVFLIQDELITWQKDYSFPPAQQDVADYHHKDILLGTINGSYGTELFDGSSTIGEVFENHYSYQVPADVIYNANAVAGEECGLSIIAYLMNRDTYEIIQVTEIPIYVTY